MYCILKDKEVKIIDELQLKDPKKKVVVMSHRCTGGDGSCDMTKHEQCLFNNKR